MAQYDITLRDYWRILRKRKAIVIFSTIMLGLTSFATAFMSKPEPKYRATAKVQYEKTQTAEEAYAQALGGGDELETQQAVITSYPVVERVAYRLALTDSTKAEEQRIPVIENLRSSIKTDVEGLTNIISISVTRGDRYEARNLANTVAEEYVQYNYETRNALVLKKRSFIKTQRDTIEARLRVAQNKLKQFQEETQIISVDAQTSSTLSKLNAAQEALERMTKLRNSIDRLIEEARSGGHISENSLSSIPPEEGGATFNQLNGQLQALNMERNKLLVNYTEAHPYVQDLDTRKLVIMKNMLASLRVQREVLSRRIQTQRSLVEDLQDEYKRLPDLGIRLDELRRAVDVQATLLQYYEQQYQESRVAQSEEVRDVTILQKALLPGGPINPSKPSTSAGIGVVLGLILGLVFAFIVETLDTSMGTIEDVEEYLDVSVVGIIPHIDIEDIREAQVKSGAGEIDPEALERRLHLAALFEPRSILAESYRALRTNIQFATLEKGAKAISITSASNQEGKSTTIANLAMTLAQAGNRTLLVDCDLRRPTLARIFGLDREPGLTDVILGNYNWPEVVRTVTDIMVGDLGMEDIMMTPGMGNLNIITCGVIPPNPAEITDSRRMDEFIEAVKGQYDVVLLDSPPVLQATDAAILGTKIDGVLLVYKVGEVSRGALRRAKVQLDNVGISVLGVILNGLRPEVSGDIQDLPYYHYYYSYGSEQETGSPIKRYYNRTRRHLKTAWQNAYTHIRPFLQAVLRKPGRERGEAATPPAATTPDEAPEDEEDIGLFSQTLHILFWTLLILFLAAGILWQLDMLRPLLGLAPSIPAKSGQISPLPGQAPSGETAPSEAPPAPLQGTEEKPPLGSKPPGAEIKTMPNATQRPHRKRPAVSSSLPAPHPVIQKAALARERPTAPSPRFAVHVSSYKTRMSARQDAAAYRKKGYPVRLARVHIPKRGVFYRVLVGQFSSRREAGRAAEYLKSKKMTGYAAIVPLPESAPDLPLSQKVVTPLIASTPP